MSSQAACGPVHSLEADALEVTGGGNEVREQVAGPFRISSVVFRPHLHLPSHYHERACVSVILEGRFLQEFPTRTCDCPRDAVLAKPAGERHADRWFAAPTRHLIIEVEEAGSDGLGACCEVIRRVGHGTDPGIALLARRMLAELARPDDLTPTALEGLALQAFTRMLRTRRRVPGPGRVPEWLTRTREQLHGCFRTAPALQALAREAGVHPDYLSRAFVARYGVSISEYVRLLRVEAALAELVATDAPIASVAQRCGFSDQSHLTRLVKHRTGITPRQYREAHR
jgi:AraC family transcriptional regulator